MRSPIQRTVPKWPTIAMALWSAIGVPRLARGEFAPIYGGPALNAATGGFVSPVLPVLPGAPLNAAGAVVGYAAKQSANGVALGNRAVRFSSTGGVIELGNLGADANGLTNSYSYAINATGMVAGAAEKFVGNTAVGYRAVRYSATGTFATELGNLGTDANGIANDYGVAINTAGAIAGYADKYSGGDFLGQRATRWGATGSAATELGNLGTDDNGVANSKAFAINAAGTIVGYAEAYTAGVNNGWSAVRWSSSGTAATVLGNMGTSSAGRAYDQALAINDAGTIVGSADKYVGSVFQGTRAAMWSSSSTAAIELGNLGADLTGVSYSQANAINSSGAAAGFANKYASGSFRGKRAVRWNAGSTIATELGNLGTDAAGVTQSESFAINSIGAAVGYANSFSTQGAGLGQRAVLWRADGAAINLNSLVDPASGWVLNKAMAINDLGWIAGIGLYDPDGAGGQDAYSRMYLLQTPLARWLLGDFDRNGVLSVGDLSTMLSALTNLPSYEAVNSLSNADLLAIGDVNGDGKVTNADLQGLIGLLMGGGTGAQAVPEPGTILQGALGIVLMLVGWGWPTCPRSVTES